MFCGKCCVRINKCVFIVVKIKYVNSGRISDICNKVNFITKLHIFYNTWQTFYQNTHTSGGSRKIFQGVQRSLQNLNITSLKKKLHEIL